MFDDAYETNRNAKRYTAKQFAASNRNVKATLREYKKVSLTDIAGDETHLDNNSIVYA